MTSEFDFDFDDEVVTSSKLPSVQMLNPPKLPTGKLEESIKQNGGISEWGFFIPKESAEAAGFIPDSRWAQVTQEFDRGGTCEGWRSGNPRMVVLSRSQIEVCEMSHREGSDGFNKTFLGVGYIGSQPTRWMDLTYTKEKIPGTDTSRYQSFTRHLLLFVGEDNTPLHTDAPFLYNGKGASVTVFGQEYTQHRYDFSNAHILEKGGNPRSERLSDKALNYTVFDIEFGFARNNPGHSPFSFPAARKYAGTEEKVVTRKRHTTETPRFVTLRPATLNSLKIDRDSPARATVSQFLADHAGFENPPEVVNEPAQSHADDGYESYQNSPAYGQPSQTQPAYGQPAAAYGGGYPPAPIAPPPPAPVPVRDRFAEFVAKVTHSGLNRDGWKTLKPDNYPDPFVNYFPTLELVYEHGVKNPGFLEWFETFVTDAFRAPAPIPSAPPIGAQSGWDNADDADPPF